MTTIFDQSKRIKELCEEQGIKIWESEKWHYRNYTDENSYTELIKKKEVQELGDNGVDISMYPAYSTDELLKIIPGSIEEYLLTITKEDGYHCRYSKEGKWIGYLNCFNDNLSIALGDLLIRLLEKKLI